MVEDLHPLLIRQLKRSAIDLEQLPESFRKLIGEINVAYKNADQDRLLLERSLDLSAQEVFVQNQEMRATLESLPQIFENAQPGNIKLSFSELLLRYVEQLKSSKDSLSKQAALLREQAFELAVARDEALESSKAKSAFLANMSHEIRTPMNATLGLMKIVLGTELLDDQREYLTLAEQSGMGLLSLIEDILDLSKIEAGKLDIEHIEFKPRQIIKSALATLYNQAASKGIQLLADIDQNLPSRLISDPNRLKQVLINFINNAVKFTNKGHVLLKIKCLGEDSNGRSRILFAVQDTGIGIDSEKQGAIFNAFQQGDESVTRKFGGTGLGLSICQHLVGLLGGRISLKSTIGVGSEFSFELNLPRVVENETLTFVRESSYDHVEFSIITESAVLGSIIKTYIKDFSGNKIKVKVESPDSIEFAHEAPSGVVFYDIGYGLNAQSRALLESLAQSNSKIIVVASMLELGEKEKLYKMGAKAVLFKPFIDSDLEISIKRAFSVDKGSSINKSGTFSKPEFQRALRIVVVDDLHVNRLVAQKTLEQRGHEVICFEGGSTLFQHLEQNRFFPWTKSGEAPDCDLVLLDIQMPNLDGMETAQLIRQWEMGRSGVVSKRLPIVALTAHALKGDRERFIESGMDDYLRKPLDLDALALLLKKIERASNGPRSSGKNARAKRSETCLIFDRDQMLSRFDNDLGIVKEIVSAFIEDRDALNRALDESLDSQDSERIRKAAHALKGSLLDVCGNAAGEIAEELETAAREGRGGYQDLRAQLKEKTELLDLELNKIVA